MADDTDLDSEVRSADPDRWLASRFIADVEARADVVALYAFNHELARAAEIASQPLIGEMRLAWWREALEEIFEARPLRRHPVAFAVAGAVRRRGLARPALEALVDARLRDLDGWPLRAEEVADYVDATAGRLMALTAEVLSPGVDPEALRHAARAWGLAGLGRLKRLPPEWSTEDLRRQVEAALARSRAELEHLPVAAFPAVAYAALARPYGKGVEPGALARRARMAWAVARGRL